MKISQRSSDKRYKMALDGPIGQPVAENQMLTR